MSPSDPYPPLQDAVLCQVGIVVKNADCYAEKFLKFTGMAAPAAIITDDFEQARTLFRGKPTSARAKLIIFGMGQVSVEIIEPLGAPSTWREFLDRRGEGMHHIGFTVPDAVSAAE